MEHKYEAAINYLTPPESSFWNWDEQGAVVIWNNGSTIAFREELAVVVGRLSATGLPPIDAILLLIAATRAYWAEDSIDLEHRLRARDEDNPFLEQLSDLWSDVFARLSGIHEFPDELIRSPEAKADLATIVFESSLRIVTPEIATAVYEVLAQRLVKAGQPPIELPRLPTAEVLAEGMISASHDPTDLSARRIQSKTQLYLDLRQLRQGLEHLTKQSLLLRQQTGLDDVPDPAPVDYIVEPVGIGQLLQQLADDEELGGMCRLARNLAAVVQLPRSILDSDELPLGGVSDLSNRGSLDRLLLSELAHDDLVLATRVALNEALYLRREVAPSFPPERRHVLIDSGLRMWGIPRVFASAVALSMAVGCGKDGTLSAYRAADTTVIPVDLSTREGLIEHLAVLEPEAHPGKALAEFFERVLSTGSDGNVVLVTTEAVLNDADFQRDLSTTSLARFYVATVNRDGDFQLWSYGLHGRKIQASLRIDLDKLLKSKTVHRSLVDPAIDPNLPAIHHVRPYPIRMPYFRQYPFSKEVFWTFPIRSKAKKTDSSRNGGVSTEVIIVSANPVVLAENEVGVIVLTRDHRLLLFDDPKRGGLKLAEGLPHGKCMTSWTSDDGDLNFAVIHREAEAVLELLTVDLVHRTVQCDRLPTKYFAMLVMRGQLMGVTMRGGVIFVIYRNLIEAIDASTRELLHSMNRDGPMRWIRGRYFFNSSHKSNDAWHALFFDGHTIGLQRVPLGKYRYSGPLASLFDRRGRDGAFGIDGEGRLIDLTEQREWRLMNVSSSNVQVLDVDEDGRRILLRCSHLETKHTAIYLADTETCEAKVVACESIALFDAFRLDLGVQPMRKFTSVLVVDEKLTLVSRRQVHWQFCARQGRLVMEQTRQRKPARLSQGLERPKHSSTEPSLAVARWDDGSRVWIDTTGVMHLQSSDPSIPEASLVLATGAVAVWVSDGRTLGLNYYFDAPNSISPEEFIDTILQPFLSKLC